MRNYNASAGVLVVSTLYMCASGSLQWKGIKQGVLDDGCKCTSDKMGKSGKIGIDP